jgi:hypothetical protein
VRLEESAGIEETLSGLESALIRSVSR